MLVWAFGYPRDPQRVVRLAKAENITSIADFIAARYGKNQAVAAMVTRDRGGRRRCPTSRCS